MNRADVLRHCETMCSLACPNRGKEPCVEEFLLFLSPSDIYRFCTSLCREEFFFNSMPKCCQSETCTNTFCVFCHEEGVYVCDGEGGEDDDDEDEERDTSSLLTFMFYLPGENAANSPNGPKLIYNCLFFHCSKVCEVIMGYSLKKAFQVREEEAKEISSSPSSSSSSTAVTKSRQRDICFCDVCGYIEASGSFVRMHNGKEHTINICGSSCLYSEFRRMQTKQQLHCIKCRQPVGEQYCVLRREGNVRCSCTDCFEANRICHVCGKPTQLFACGQCRTTRYCSKDCQKSDWTKHKETCREKAASEENKVKLLENKSKSVENKAVKEAETRKKQTDPLEVD